jgi:hypothetical protein
VRRVFAGESLRGPFLRGPVSISEVEHAAERHLGSEGFRRGGRAGAGDAGPDGDRWRSPAGAEAGRVGCTSNSGRGVLARWGRTGRIPAARASRRRRSRGFAVRSLVAARVGPRTVRSSGSPTRRTSRTRSSSGQGVGDEIGAQVVGGRPADDAG